MSKNTLRIGLIGVVVMLVLAACAPPPTAAPAEPVQVEVTRVVVETQVSTVVETQVVEVEVPVEVPAEVQKIRIAYQTQLDFGDLPSVLATELMADKGYAVLPTYYAEGNLAIAALAEGQADIGIGNVGAYWNAVGQGADILTIMVESRNPWSLEFSPGGSSGGTRGRWAAPPTFRNAPTWKASATRSTRKAPRARPWATLTSRLTARTCSWANA